MRAVLLNPPDVAGENMVVTEVADASAGPGEALIAVEHAGCNFADTMMRRGIYPHPKGYPLVAGLEVAGKVVSVGTGVTQVAAGDRVAAFSEDAGGFAELCAIPAERLVLAVPVAPADTIRDLRNEADEVVCLSAPKWFRAVGLHYSNFDQTSDAEVVRLLREADRLKEQESASGKQ